eukprot:scaffold1029_cov164-Ochromonas_danica.AAC.3
MTRKRAKPGTDEESDDKIEKTVRIWDSGLLLRIRHCFFASGNSFDPKPPSQSIVKGLLYCGL